MLIVPVIPGMNMMMFWPTVREIGREKVVSYQHELVQKSWELILKVGKSPLWKNMINDIGLAY